MLCVKDIKKLDLVIIKKIHLLVYNLKILKFIMQSIIILST
jgi:hypothetical protein